MRTVQALTRIKSSFVAR